MADMEEKVVTQQQDQETPMILCENLVKIYKTKDSEVLALQGLELSVARGELLAIIGNSGSGKSTFLNMIGGLDRPSAGSLFVDGKNLFKLTEKELVEYKRNTVGFVWQNNARNLLPYLTATENIQMPMMLTGKANRAARAQELLELVGMSHKRNRKLHELSGGEQQRIAIAIALANNPKLLLADEPTGSVDPKTAKFILEVFRELSNNGLTTVIVTHDRMLAKSVNRVVAIRDGKTSSEMIARTYSRERLASVGSLSELEAETEEEIREQEEFAILDRAGRVQIPRELLDSIGVSGNKIRMKQENGQIIIESADIN